MAMPRKGEIKEEILKIKNKIKEIQTYIQQGKSLIEISEIFNIKYMQLYALLRKEKIAFNKITNLNRQSIRYRKGHDKQIKLLEHKNEIIHMYSELFMSMQTIAERYNTTSATVLKFLRDNNIQTRKKNGLNELIEPKYDYDTLFELYHIRTMSLKDIAIELGYNNGTMVMEDMKRHNIPRRTYKEAGIVRSKTKPELIEKLNKHLFEMNTRNWIENPSSLERGFMEWANENNIAYTHQFQLCEYCHRYDFKIDNTNILVEMDGDYWHNTEESRKRDKIFEKIAAASNYKVIRILGSEYKKFKFDIFDQKVRIHLNANT